MTQVESSRAPSTAPKEITGLRKTQKRIAEHVGKRVTEHKIFINNTLLFLNTVSLLCNILFFVYTYTIDSSDSSNNKYVINIILGVNIVIALMKSSKLFMKFKDRTFYDKKIHIVGVLVSLISLSPIILLLIYKEPGVTEWVKLSISIGLALFSFYELFFLKTKTRKFNSATTATGTATGTATTATTTTGTATGTAGTTKTAGTAKTGDSKTVRQ